MTTICLSGVNVINDKKQQRPQFGFAKLYNYLRITVHVLNVQIHTLIYIFLTVSNIYLVQLNPLMNVCVHLVKCNVHRI